MSGPEEDLVAGLRPGEFRLICGGLGTKFYVTPCVSCREPIKVWGPKNCTYKCKTCREAEREAARVLVTEIRRLRYLRRLEAAKELLRKLYGDKAGWVEEYDRGFEVIAKYIERPHWFQSLGEVMVGLELIRNGLRARHQVRMRNWRVDFVLPEMKVILEIDGLQHRLPERKQADSFRDAAIIAAKGPEWEIVRISDELIKGNPRKLLPALRNLLCERRRWRKKRGGQLPPRYSKAI